MLHSTIPSSVHHPLPSLEHLSPKIHPKIAFPNCFFIRNFFASENCFSEKQYYNCILGTLKKLKKRINTCLNFFSKNLFPNFILMQSFPFEIKNFSVIFLKIFLHTHSSLTTLCLYKQAFYTQPEAQRSKS